MLIDQVLGSAQRAAKLTSSLLAFSRKQQFVIRPISLNDLITQMHGFLERIIGEDVELKTSLCDGETTILADRGQIEQVVMNLVINARDAMPEGGHMTISTGVRHLDEYALDDGSVAAGRYALLTLADTGVGISVEEQERIFEPFFTTKEVGKGTGLGLSMVYGIVRQHNGWITVESELGGGSCFTIYLPLSGSGPDVGNARVDAPCHGTETILLIEDDEQVLSVNKAILEESGYSIITARNGLEAIELFRAAGGNVDLAVIDAVMPQMNGKQVYDALLKLNPDQRVLFTSGYTFDVLERMGIPEQSPFIAKPLDCTEFLHAVRDLLDRKS
jgi:CheY-like chemotaxis protein